VFFFADAVENVLANKWITNCVEYKGAGGAKSHNRMLATLWVI